MEMSVVFSFVQGSNYRSMEDGHACSYQVWSRGAGIVQWKMERRPVCGLEQGCTDRSIEEGGRVQWRDQYTMEMHTVYGLEQGYRDRSM